MPAAINWTPELEQAIIDGLESHSLRKLCSLNDALPSRDSVQRHMDESPDFASKCVRAREEHGELMDDRILEVAQKVENGLLDAKAGQVVISAFQWRASKLKPKKFGERTTLAGDPEAPLILADRIANARKRTK